MFKEVAILKKKTPVIISEDLKFTHLIIYFIHLKNLFNSDQKKFLRIDRFLNQ